MTAHIYVAGLCFSAKFHPDLCSWPLLLSSSLQLSAATVGLEGLRELEGAWKSISVFPTGFCLSGFASGLILFRTIVVKKLIGWSGEE